jgi:hypothetical protein
LTQSRNETKRAAGNASGLPEQDGISGIGQPASEIGQPSSEDGKT